MKKIIYLTLIAMAFASGQVFAAKSCEELKGEVATKVESKGVTKYTLEIVDADQVGEKQVVGSCEGGAKKLVYTRK
jgi:hypothetical protein